MLSIDTIKIILSYADGITQLRTRRVNTFFKFVTDNIVYQIKKCLGKINYSLGISDFFNILPNAIRDNNTYVLKWYFSIENIVISYNRVTFKIIGNKLFPGNQMDNKIFLRQSGHYRFFSESTIGEQITHCSLSIIDLIREASNNKSFESAKYLINVCKKVMEHHAVNNIINNAFLIACELHGLTSARWLYSECKTLNNKLLLMAIKKGM